jgi:hypothetical protein
MGTPQKPNKGPTGYGDVVNTASAFLFLEHSHPMKELTAKLPYKADELNRGLAGSITDRSLPLERPTIAPSQSEKTKR